MLSIGFVMITIKKSDKRPAGRPRGFDREKALRAAMQLFWQHGYDGTSLAQLTAAMTINAPSLYAAFGSKQQLYQEVLDLYLAEQGGRSLHMLRSGATARESVEAMLLQMARDFTTEQNPRGCLIASGALRCADDNKPVANYTAGLRQLAQNAISERLSQGVRQHEIALDTDHQTLAGYFSTVVQGMSVQARDGGSEAQLVAIVKLAMRAWPGPRAKRPGSTA